MNEASRLEKAVKYGNVVRIEKNILKRKDPSLSLEFCKLVKTANISEHQKIILESEHLYFNYSFCKYIKGIDIKEHEKIILEAKSPLYSYKFALNVEGADIKAHEKVLLENFDFESLVYNYLFAKDIKGANVNAHRNIILSSKDVYYNYLFAKDIEGIDIKAHEKIVLENGTLLYNYEFAKNIKGADIKAHGDIILEKSEKYFNDNFLPNVPGAKEIYKDYIEEQRKKMKTLAIIKPDGMENIEKIIGMIYKSGLKIVEYDVRTLDEEILREHYSHLVTKPFFTEIVEYMSSAPVAIMILEGENAVPRFRKLMGPTDSTLAEPGTIRGEFGTDKSANAVHGSDSIENAEIEIKRFFKEKEKIKTK